jgi:hypothetical protein
VVIVCGVLAGLQILFVAMLLAAQAVPDNLIVSHLVEGIDDGIYGPTGRPDYMGGDSFAFTECVVLGTGLGRSDLGVWERTMRMPRLGSCGPGDDQLRALDRGETVRTDIEYFRYWAGYTVLTRPVLALWGLGSLHMVSGALLVAAIAAAVVAVARRTSTVYALALVVPLIISSNILSMPSTSLHGALANAAAFLCVAMTAGGASYGVRGAVFGTVVGAAVFNYIDLLTTPAIPWMLSAAVAGAVVLSSTGRVGHAVRAVAAVGIAWPLAFAFTWLSRWVIAVVALGWDHAADVIADKIEERTQGAVASADSSRMTVITDNLRYWLDRIGTAQPTLLLAVVVTVTALVAIVLRHDKPRLVWFLVLAAPAIVAPLWYAVLRNHSLIHLRMVYASVPAAVGVTVGAALHAALAPRSLSAGATLIADLELEERPNEAAEDHRQPEDQAEGRRDDDAHLFNRIEIGEATPAPPQQ